MNYFKTKATNIENPLLSNYLTIFYYYLCSLKFFFLHLLYTYSENII